MTPPINFNLYRLQYRSNKNISEPGSEINNEIELHFSADQMFSQPAETEPQPNGNGEYVIDLSEDGTGTQVGIHHVVFAQTSPYEDDYSLGFTSECSTADVERKPKGNFNKKCNIKQDPTEEFEISELILQRSGDFYKLEVSLITSLSNENFYKIQHIENDDQFIMIHITDGHPYSDLDNKKCSGLLSLENPIEIRALLNGAELPLGYVQLWEE